MVAARAHAGCRARREAAETIGFEPLSAFGRRRAHADASGLIDTPSLRELCARTTGSLALTTRRSAIRAAVPAAMERKAISAAVSASMSVLRGLGCGGR